MMIIDRGSGLSPQSLPLTLLGNDSTKLFMPWCQGSRLPPLPPVISTLRNGSSRLRSLVPLADLPVIWMHQTIMLYTRHLHLASHHVLSQLTPLLDWCSQRFLREYHCVLRTVTQRNNHQLILQSDTTTRSLWFLCKIRACVVLRLMRCYGWW